MTNGKNINPAFKEPPTEFFSTEPIGVQGVVEDLPGLEEDLDKVFTEIDNRERQTLIEQGIEKFGIPEPEEPDNVFSQIRNSLINSPMTQMAAGVQDALLSTVESLGDIIDMGFETSQLQQLSETGELEKVKAPGVGEAIRKVTGKIPEIPESEKLLGNITRTAARYATNFIPFMKAVNILAKIPKIGRAIQSGTAGMLTAFTALDPDSPKFGEMIVSLHPKLKIPFLDFLKARREDTNAEKRFKNAIDDALAFGVIGGLFFAMGKFVKRALALGKKLNETTIKPKLVPKTKEQILAELREVPKAVEIETGIINKIISGTKEQFEKEFVFHIPKSDFIANKIQDVYKNFAKEIGKSCLICFLTLRHLSFIIHVKP